MLEKKIQTGTKTVNESERYRVTIKGQALNSILIGMPPGIRSSIIQIALSQWVTTVSAKKTLSFMDIRFMETDEEKENKIEISETDDTIDMRSMLEESICDF